MSKSAVTIILAEDDDGQANLIERNLQRAGVVNGFIRLKDGQQALDFVRAEGEFVDRNMGDAAVLLLDINMPRVDGFEVLRRLKGDPETAPLPVIMLTTTDDPREIDRCYKAGCNVYITKPVEYDAFIEAVKRLGLFLQIVKSPLAARKA